MLLPITTDAPRHRTSPVVLTLIAVTVGAFLYQESLAWAQERRLLIEYALIPRRFSDPAGALANGLNPHDRTSFVTMMFLHGNWLHLIFNMWTLWLFGRAVETRMGSFRFTLLYLVSGLLASAAHATVLADSPIPTLGASGAIAGVLGAHATLYPKAKVRLFVLIVVIPWIFALSALWYVGIWFGLQLLNGTAVFSAQGETGGVAWWAHIGGFLAGLVAVRLLTPPRLPQPPPPPFKTGPVISLAPPNRQRGEPAQSRRPPWRR